jgi:hypothetical protein
MTTDTLNPPQADTEADRKAALKAEGEKLGIKFHPRHSAQRMADMIAEHRAGGSAAPAPAPVAAVAPPQPAPQPYNVPPGTTIMANITAPGQLGREEEERKRLMDRCTQLGIAQMIPPRANPDAIREIMGRHMAENAQKIAMKEAEARVKQKGPETVYVQMRVLPLGHLKISKGIHIPGIGDEMYEFGDVIEMLDIKIAQEHHNAGRGEILRA